MGSGDEEDDAGTFMTRVDRQGSYSDSKRRNEVTDDYNDSRVLDQQNVILPNL